MIWKKCTLLKKEKTGEDKLGNPIYEDMEVKSTTSRFSPWTEEQINLEGYEVTKNEQEYIIPIPYSAFPECHYVELEEKRLEITQKMDLTPRFTLVRVKKYKG